MKTLATPQILPRFVERFRQLTPEHRAQWGTMSAHQMVRHVGDATAAVLKQRPFAARAGRPNRMVKFIVLRVLPQFPRGARSGTNPAGLQMDGREFGTDIDRAVALLEMLVSAPAQTLESFHPLFGPMTQQDWLRWAYLHTDHHLRNLAREYGAAAATIRRYQRANRRRNADADIGAIELFAAASQL